MSAVATSDEAQALGTAVRSLCRHHAAEIAHCVAPAGLWADLAAMGVLGLGSPEVGGGPPEVLSAHFELGLAGAAGPFAAAALGAAVLDAALRASVIEGSAVVAVCDSAGVATYGQVAAAFVEIGADGLWLAACDAPPTPMPTMAGEPWARVRLSRLEALDERGAAVLDLAIGAWLAGAAAGALDLAVSYARDRRQFGRSIGDFQAVSHRLADCRVGCDGAAAALRLAATATGPAARSWAAAARLAAADAALAAVFAAHQIVGALGMAREYELGTRSLRVRQVVSSPPHAALTEERVLAGMVEPALAIADAGTASWGLNDWATPGGNGAGAA